MPIEDLSGTSGTVELGNIQPGTHKYALCIDYTPISQILTLQVKEDGETANAAISATVLGTGVYDVSGRAWKKISGHGIFVKNGKKMSK